MASVNCGLHGHPLNLKGMQSDLEPLKEQFIMSIIIDKWAVGEISECSKTLEIVRER